MGGMKITELDFVRLLPAFMRDDEAAIALSKAINQLIGEPAKRLRTVSTWSKIDDLTEEECDEMAWELDIDWYDSVGMSLQEKRETIKSAQLIKSKRGTKWAVERLISAYFGEGYVAEWYEMGDEPYTFVVLTTETYISPENYVKFVEAANAAKNERSHVKGIFYYWPQGPDPGIETAPSSKEYLYEFDKCGTKPRPALVGILLDHRVEARFEETHYLYGFKETGTIEGASVVGTAIVGKSTVTGSATGEGDCGTYPRIVMTGAAIKALAEIRAGLQNILYDFPECGADRPGAITGAAVVGTALVGTATVYNA